MASIPDRILTPEEYLRLERAAEFKSEYYDGQVYAMAGASETHNLIVANLIATLWGQLRGSSCRVYPSDLKVASATRFFYPDVTVICGATQFYDDKTDTVLNPTLVVEVLSESTASYDRGKKFLAYQAFPTLREYLLVSQDEPVLEHYLRQEEEAWLYTRHGGLEAVLELPALQAGLALSDVYANVEF